MGILNSQPVKNSQFHLSKLSLIKKSHIGTHYRNKKTGQQFLQVQSYQRPQIENGSLIQYIKYHFKERLSLKSRHIPQIIEYRDNFSSFCNITCGFSLLMRHPTKSIEQQIVYRKEMKQKFGEGQIWNIIYSVLKALVYYDALSYNVNLNQENIYISNQGDVIVSDAYLYSSINLLINPNKSKLAAKNIQRLIIIVNALMQQQIQSGYSPILYQLLQKLSEPQNHNYRKACTQVVYFKCELDKCTKQAAQIQRQYRNIQQNKEREQMMDNIYERFNQLKLCIAQLSNKPYINKVDRSNLQNNFPIKHKNKFHRSTPINHNHKPLQCISNNVKAQTVPSPSHQKWVEVSQFSSFTQLENKQQSNKPISSLQNEVFSMQSIKQQPVIQSEMYEMYELEQKNRFFLQSLIKKEANMILQVTESDNQQSSIYSRTRSRHQSRNLSFNPQLRNLDGVDQSEETGDNF